jgi:hypothetical protein
MYDIKLMLCKNIIQLAIILNIENKYYYIIVIVYYSYNNNLI